MLRNKFGDKVDPELVEAVRREIMADMQQYRELTEDNPGRGRSLFSTGRTFNNRHRSMGVLRREVRRELQAIQHIEQRLGRVKNPRVRKMVYEILEEAGDLGLGVDDVLSSFPRGGGGLGDLMGLGRDRSLPWIIGAALLGLALYPNARENIKKWWAWSPRRPRRYRKKCKPWRSGPRKRWKIWLPKPSLKGCRIPCSRMAGAQITGKGETECNVWKN